VKSILCIIIALVLTIGGEGEARAEGTCEGINLMIALQRDNQSAFDAIMKEGAGEPNGGALLWKVTKASIAPSYLFGTMHVTDARLLDVPDAVLHALNGAGAVAVENVDIMDKSVAGRKMAALSDLMFFKDGTDLRDHMSKAEQELLRQAARTFKLSYFNLIKMKPWMAATVLALPLCEKQSNASGQPFLDKALVERANRMGADVVSLETVAEQINAMAALPMNDQIAFLTTSARLATQAEDFLETMIALYLERKIGAIPAMAKYFGGNDETVEKAYGSFQEQLVDNRNLIMRDRALPLLKKGEAFIAVGALHLIGKKGLVELFRAEGYEVLPIW
jgi:uncharacterized protein YbaP (TraB family)